MDVSDDLDYRLLFEASPEGLLLANSRHVVLDANHAACRLLERTRQDLLGSNLMAYWDRGDRTPRPTVDAGRHGSVFRLLRRNARSFLAEVRLIEYHRDDGDVRTALAFREVTVADRSHAASTALVAGRAVHTTRAGSPVLALPAPQPPPVARTNGYLTDGQQPGR